MVIFILVWCMLLMILLRFESMSWREIRFLPVFILAFCIPSTRKRALSLRRSLRIRESSEPEHPKIVKKEQDSLCASCRRCVLSCDPVPPWDSGQERYRSIPYERQPSTASIAMRLMSLERYISREQEYNERIIGDFEKRYQILGGDWSIEQEKDLNRLMEIKKFLDQDPWLGLDGMHVHMRLPAPRIQHSGSGLPGAWYNQASPKFP